MYCITHDMLGETFYLAWQSPVWDDDGYFWTRKETFKECLCDDTKEHPFLFRSRREAVAHLKKLNIPQRCTIEKWCVD